MREGVFGSEGRSTENGGRRKEGVLRMNVNERVFASEEGNIKQSGVCLEYERE